MLKINWIITESNITVNYNGQTHIIDRVTSDCAEKVLEAIKNEQFDDIPKLVSIADRMAEFSDGHFIVRDAQIYIDDVAVPTMLSNKILQFMKEGLPYKPLIKFAQNLQQNPSFRAVQELFQFLEKNNHPITENGCFIAYKKIGSDFKDLRTHTFDNSVGATPTMPRNEVNEDCNVTCSNGLHVANWDYANNFYGNSDSVMIEVEVNPADVVAVPVDYNQAKMRCCKYLVLGVVDKENSSSPLRVVNNYITTDSMNYEDDEDGDMDDEDGDMDDEEEENDVEEEEDAEENAAAYEEEEETDSSSDEEAVSEAEREEFYRQNMSLGNDNINCSNEKTSAQEEAPCRNCLCNQSNSLNACESMVPTCFSGWKNSWDAIEFDALLNARNSDEINSYLFKLNTGHNLIRIVTDFMIKRYHVYKNVKINCSASFPILDDYCPLCKGTELITTILVGIINRSNNEYKILEIPNGLENQIYKLITSQKYQNLSEYDIDIVANTDGTFIVTPKSKNLSEVFDPFKLAKFDYLRNVLSQLTLPLNHEEIMDAIVQVDKLR
jgi:hypothetical protein